MPNEVELIKSRLDIVDIVGEYVRLKQSGQNWKGLCPFHTEKTPSFMVHREKQIWHCFGCGLGGDVFEFIQRVENVDFSEALELLAKKAQVILQPKGSLGGGSSQRLKLFQLVEIARDFYHRTLLESPQAEKARSYLKTRGVAAESFKLFNLGYALAEWDKLLVFLRGKGFGPDEVVAAGLALKSERGPGAYDRFRDRLMFPIADVQGRTVGFGGRTLDPNNKEAKYINSPQGQIYNKSGIVYNLDQAKAEIKAAGFAVLVEGYMDVIGCFEVGIKNVVATSGTALTPEQVKLLKRYTNELRLAFDADLAGQSASERGVEVALKAELEVKMISLPLGKDPDECARKDPSALRQAIEQALPIGDHAFKTVLGQVDPATREGKKAAAAKLLATIARLPDPVERDHYLKRLSRELDVDERSLRERLAAMATVGPRLAAEAPTPKLAAEAIPRDRHEVLSERLLAALIHAAEQVMPLLREVSAEIFAAPAPRQLYSRLSVYYNDRQRLDLDEFKLELQTEPELIRLLDTLFLQAQRDFENLSLAEVEAEATLVMRHLRHHYLSQELKRLTSAIRQAEQAHQAAELQELLSRFTAVSRELAQL